MLGNDSRNNIDNYVNEVITRDFMVMNSFVQVNNVFSDSIDKFLSSLSMEELMDLRSYTGYNFRNINALLRGNWNYEVNGYLDENKKMEYRKLANSISLIMSKFETPNIDFTTFRGTTLDSFSGYGISKISDLKKLEGRFMYEQGFTSTSILESSSYSNKQLDDGRFCNISIRYLIPSEFNEGVLLTNNDLSYSINQNEYLISSGSLSKVIDVMVDENNNNALLTCILVPKKIYDLDYSRSRGMQ